MIIRTASLITAAAICGLLILFSSSCMERFQKKGSADHQAGETAAEHASHSEGAGHEGETEEEHAAHSEKEGHAEHGEGHEGESEKEHAGHSEDEGHEDHAEGDGQAEGEGDTQEGAGK